MTTFNRVSNRAFSALLLTLCACAPTDTSTVADSTSTNMLVLDAKYPTDVSFRAYGQEPAWLVIIDDSLRLIREYGTNLSSVHLPKVEADESGVSRYTVVIKDTVVTISVRDTLCADAMSGREFTSRVDLTIGDSNLSGCGGKSSPLIDGGEWQVLTINGSPLIEGSDATMQFTGESRIVGKATCNRYSAPFVPQRDSIVVQNAIATRMSCGAEKDAQEAQFLSVLSGTLVARIAGDTVLHLSRDGVAVITARAQSY